MKNLRVTRFMRQPAAAVLSVILALFATATASAQNTASGAPAAFDEERLIQRITDAVVERLKDEDFLRERIDAGVQDYIRRQVADRNAKREAARVDQERAGREKARLAPPVDAESDHVYGSPDARITLIEYSDFECPYCKRFHESAKQLVDASEGTVNWVYRHYPLGFHDPGATRQAEASECAAELGGNDAFWNYSDAIYERTTSNGKGFPIAKLTPLAEEIGLDGPAFQACLDSGRHAARVKKELADGARAGVTGTPGSILRDNTTGDVRVVMGALPVERLQSQVDDLLR